MRNHSIHPNFKLNGQSFTFEGLNAFACDLKQSNKTHEIAIGKFLSNWLDSSEVIEVTTSGSTGTPKLILIAKEAMIQSARATGSFFNLKPKDTSLLCMSADYIAGKMMLVRALVLGLELDYIEPNSNPLQNIDKHYDFVAMVPMQVEGSLSKLNTVSKLIIGGAKLDNTLKSKLQTLPILAFETYGMTETVSHIAAKKIEEDYFTILPNVTISTDLRNCLVIDAPMLSKEIIVTNDIVELKSDRQFIWLGRYDNVINSGGVKLYPEKIEEKLANSIKERYIIASEEDKLLGQRVILIIESKSKKELPNAIFDSLNKFEKPKAIYFVDCFDETETSKINRKATVNKIKRVV